MSSEPLIFLFVLFFIFLQKRCRVEGESTGSVENKQHLSRLCYECFVSKLSGVSHYFHWVGRVKLKYKMSTDVFANMSIFHLNSGFNILTFQSSDFFYLQEREIFSLSTFNVLELWQV